MKLAQAPLDEAPPAEPPNLAARPDGTTPGTCRVLPVLGQVDAVCGRLVHAARLAGLQPVVCAQPEQALARAMAAQAGMVLVQEAALQQAAAAALALLRAAGPLRVVLVGPDFGSASHGRALRLGYDEVWPADTPTPVLALMLCKAHGLTPDQGLTAAPLLASIAAVEPAVAHAPAPLRLQVDARTGGCRWGAHAVQLTRSSAVLLEGLQHAYPQCATRAHLARLLVSMSGSTAAGLSPAGRQRRVDTQVSRLRAELARGGLHALTIVSVRFIGYRLLLPGQ